MLCICSRLTGFFFLGGHGSVTGCKRDDYFSEVVTVFFRFLLFYQPVLLLVCSLATTLLFLFGRRRPTVLFFPTSRDRTNQISGRVERC